MTITQTVRSRTWKSDSNRVQQKQLHLQIQTLIVLPRKYPLIEHSSYGLPFLDSVLKASKSNWNPMHFDFTFAFPFGFPFPILRV